MSTHIYVIRAASRPSDDRRTSVCTLQPQLLNSVALLEPDIWVVSTLSAQLGLPLKVCNISSENTPILTTDAPFRRKIKNSDAVLNYVANRLLCHHDTTETNFGREDWLFWDTTLIARVDGKNLDIEYLHAMDHFLRGTIAEIKQRGNTLALTNAKKRDDYFRAIKDTSFTAEYMAATWEWIKNNGLRLGYDKYKDMGNPFKVEKAKQKGVERVAGKEEPRTCAFCGGSSFWLKACGGCREVWYCGRICEKRGREVHQAVCGAMEVDG